ncbi:MAG: nucleotidyltransferase family protein [Intrasporangium sp.]|nr:nucleotidyltransferase family protein [Intrasporangium sp.]
MTETAAPARAPLSGPTGRLVAVHREELREVLRRHGVTNAQIFGSVARGDDHPGSDLDLLIELPRGTTLFDMAGIQAELEGVLGAEVDLGTIGSLKPRIRRRVERDLVAL